MYLNFHILRFPTERRTVFYNLITSDWLDFCVCIVHLYCTICTADIKHKYKPNKWEEINWRYWGTIQYINSPLTSILAHRLKSQLGGEKSGFLPVSVAAESEERGTTCSPMGKKAKVPSCHTELQRAILSDHSLHKLEWWERFSYIDLDTQVLKKGIGPSHWEK